MEVGHSFRSKWGGVPTEMGQHSEIGGARSERSGAARPGAPPSMSEHFRGATIYVVSQKDDNVIVAGDWHDLFQQILQC
jgi:hypothetical protein